MSDERWRRIEEICHDALERDADERAPFVRAECRGDESLRLEVESLLANQSRADALGSGLGIGDSGLDLIGHEIGSYRILSLLGSGGMGEVYRARDTRLARDVALKILPRAFTSDSERLARFEREARVLASLNHPHIGAIYGIEQADGVRCLVLELVEGDTLANRLANGPLQVADALTIARQIAEALEAAHEKGIIHRDLKPTNIKITPDGSVKVLDFGLAKAAGGDGSGPDLTQSPTITVDATRAGIILGTAAYMSPEQARGHLVDKRTDIWAFGCVLYEMLAGRPAFAGETISDTIGAVMRGEPDWSALPADLFPTLQVYLRRCLQKNPRERLHDAADLRLALEGAFDTKPVLAIDGRTAASADKETSPWHRRSMTAIAAIILMGLSVATVWLLKSAPAERPPATQPVARVSVPTSPLAVLGHAPSPVLALSPDGTHLAYVTGDRGRGQLYLRRLDSLEAKPVSGADDAQGPFFSPDGKSIAFFAGGQLKKVSLAGGAPVSLCPGGSHGGSWATDDRIIFMGPGGLWRVSGNGGKPELVVTTDLVALWPDVLPGGNSVLFTSADPTGENARIWIHSLQTGHRRLLVGRGSHARYVSSGYVIYASEGSLMAAPFDAVVKDKRNL